MFELLGGGVIGSVLGGLFRLAPEVMKWLDKKSERDHELAMFDRHQERLAELRKRVKVPIAAGENLSA